MPIRIFVYLDLYINDKRNIERWGGRINGVDNKAALVFGGQGSQFAGMGKRIYDAFSEARSVFVLASDVVGYDVAKMCFEFSQEELNKTIYCQICTLTVELAIYEVFKKRNIPLNAVAGLSLGEYAALVVAGVTDAKTVFALVNARAKAMENEVDDNVGNMVAVINLDIEQVEAICKTFGAGKAAVANYNAFNQVVVSVETEIFNEFMSAVKSANGRAIPLKVSRPFHHPMMQPAADKFKANLDDVIFQEPIVPIYMNVTGEPLSTNDAFSVKLYEQIVKPVQWIKTVQSMRADGIDTFYEISPKPTLASFIKNIAERKVKIIDIQTALTSCENT